MARTRLISWTRRAMEERLGMNYPKADERILAGFVKVEDAVEETWERWSALREAGGAAAEKAYRAFVRANQRSSDFLRTHSSKLIARDESEELKRHIPPARMDTRRDEYRFEDD